MNLIYDLHINQIYVSIFLIITELRSILIFQIYLYRIYQSGMIVIYDLHPQSIRDLQKCLTPRSLLVAK